VTLKTVNVRYIWRPFNGLLMQLPFKFLSSVHCTRHLILVPMGKQIMMRVFDWWVNFKISQLLSSSSKGALKIWIFAHGVVMIFFPSSLKILNVCDLAGNFIYSCLWHQNYRRLGTIKVAYFFTSHLTVSFSRRTSLHGILGVSWFVDYSS
jgi:hypothetical protein